MLTLTKVELPLFKCPICSVAVTGVKVNSEETKELFNKTAKPVPIPVTCKNGHSLIVYVYVHEDKFLIRAIMPAAKAESESSTESKKPNESPDEWFTKW